MFVKSGSHIFFGTVLLISVLAGGCFSRLHVNKAIADYDTVIIEDVQISDFILSVAGLSTSSMEKCVNQIKLEVSNLMLHHGWLKNGIIYEGGISKEYHEKKVEYFKNLQKKSSHWTPEIEKQTQQMVAEGMEKAMRLRAGPVGSNPVRARVVIDRLRVVNYEYVDDYILEGTIVFYNQSGTVSKHVLSSKYGDFDFPEVPELDLESQRIEWFTCVVSNAIIQAIGKREQVTGKGGTSINKSKNGVTH